MPSWIDDPSLPRPGHFARLTLLLQGIELQHLGDEARQVVCVWMRVDAARLQRACCRQTLPTNVTSALAAAAASWWRAAGGGGERYIKDGALPEAFCDPSPRM